MLPSIAKFEWDFFGDFQTMWRIGFFSKKEGAGVARRCFVCFAVRCRWVPDRHGISRNIIQTLVQKLQNREQFEEKIMNPGRTRIWRNSYKSRVNTSSIALLRWRPFWYALPVPVGNVIKCKNTNWCKGNILIHSFVQKLGNFREFPLDWLDFLIIGNKDRIHLLILGKFLSMNVFIERTVIARHSSERTPPCLTCVCCESYPTQPT